MKTFPALFGSTLLGMTSALAQSYSMDWFTIAGGGGTSTGGAQPKRSRESSRRGNEADKALNFRRHPPPHVGDYDATRSF